MYLLNITTPGKFFVFPHFCSGYSQLKSFMWGYHGVAINSVFTKCFNSFIYFQIKFVVLNHLFPILRLRKSFKKLQTVVILVMSIQWWLGESKKQVAHKELWHTVEWGSCAETYLLKLVCLKVICQLQKKLAIASISNNWEIVGATQSSH